MNLILDKLTKKVPNKSIITGSGMVTLAITAIYKDRAGTRTINIKDNLPILTPLGWSTFDVKFEEKEECQNVLSN
jgi:hypothetical protein